MKKDKLKVNHFYRAVLCVHFSLEFFYDLILLSTPCILTDCDINGSNWSPQKRFYDIHLYSYSTRYSPNLLEWNLHIHIPFHVMNIYIVIWSVGRERKRMRDGKLVCRTHCCCHCYFAQTMLFRVLAAAIVMLCLDLDDLEWVVGTERQHTQEHKTYRRTSNETMFSLFIRFQYHAASTMLGRITRCGNVIPLKSTWALAR